MTPYCAPSGPRHRVMIVGPDRLSPSGPKTNADADRGEAEQLPDLLAEHLERRAARRRS